MKTRVAVAGLLASLAVACGGGNSPREFQPLNVELARCEAGTGGVSALAADPETGVVYAAGWARSCEGVASSRLVVFQVSAEGQPVRMEGPWETEAPYPPRFTPFASVSLVVSGDGMLNVMVPSVGVVQSVRYQLDRQGRLVSRQSLGSSILAVAPTADGNLVFNGGPYSEAAFHTLDPDGTLGSRPITRTVPENSFFLGLYANTLAADPQFNVSWSSGRRVSRLSREGVLELAWHLDAQTNFGMLSGMASDASGNIYFADTGDYGGSTCVIRKATSAGVFSVVPTAVPVPCLPGGASTYLAIRGNQLLMAGPTDWRVVSTPL